MSDYLLLGGIALCVLSVVVVVIQLMQTRPPRAGAILLVLGIAAILAAAYAVPNPVGPAQLGAAWARVTGGEPEPAAEPAAGTVTETAPATEATQ